MTLYISVSNHMHYGQAGRLYFCPADWYLAHNAHKSTFLRYKINHRGGELQFALSIAI